MLSAPVRGEAQVLHEDAGLDVDGPEVLEASMFPKAVIEPDRIYVRDRI